MKLKLLPLLLALLILPTHFLAAQTNELECYIRSNQDPAYYLHPSNNGRWHNDQGTSAAFLTTDNGKPFIVGTKTKGDDCLWVIREVELNDSIFVQIIHKATGKLIVMDAPTDANKLFNAYLDDPTGAHPYSNTLFVMSNRSSNDRKTVAFMPRGTDKYSLNPKTNINATPDNEGKGYIKLFDVGNANSQWLLVAPPTIATTVDGTAVTITAQEPSAGVELRYTTDNTDPCGSSYKVCTAPIDVDPSKGYAIRATAVAQIGGIAVFANNEVQLTFIPTPTINLVEPGKLQFSDAMSGVSYRYTTDGNKPTTNSANSQTTYYFPDDNYTLYVCAYFKVNNTEHLSGIASQAIIPAPNITIVDGNTTLTHAESGVTIYYTTDGSTPTTSLTPYDGTPIATSSKMVIKAIAVKDGFCSAVRKKVVTATVAKTEITSLSQITSVIGNYSLTADIDASDFAGFDFETFSGTLDGNFHTISNLGVPLFAKAEDATVRNITIVNANINSSTATGAIAAVATDMTRIYNCGVLGENSSIVSTDGAAGSIVGSLEKEARVINCYSFATVKGKTPDITGGIVGDNTVATSQVNLATMMANCIFYGHIESGYAVYGGQPLKNDGPLAVNNYNYFLDGTVTNLKGYHCTWAAEAENLTRFEYYRATLNGNRRLMAWWITGEVADTALVAKWVLDPTVAPYPTLKPWKYYPSVVNRDPNQVLDANNAYVGRKAAKPYQGKLLGTLKVHVKAGSNHLGSGASEKTIDLPITDMDTLHHDYTYGKVQLPYYNLVFGNPAAADNDNRYAGNYSSKVVTGWKITAVDHHGSRPFVASSADGYNFADQHCTGKDIYDTSGRVFAQGGDYCVPQGVGEITIEAYWGQALYLVNKNYYHESVNVAGDNTSRCSFAPAGKWDASQWPATGWTGTVIDALTNDNINKFTSTASVYDNAVVLITNYHLYNSTESMGSKPYTLMSADLDFDGEPDNYLALQLGNNSDPVRLRPWRLDFLSVPELGMVAKLESNNKFPSVGKLALEGHFEITETGNIRFNEFLYDRYFHNNKNEAPFIVNAGQFKEIISSEFLNNNSKNSKNVDGTDYYSGDAIYTSYIILGGHLRMVYFAEGCHNKSVIYTRHVPLNIIGGEVGEVYLSGRNNSHNSSFVKEDNPHFNSYGGHIKLIAGAAEEVVKGSVFYQIDHSIIGEFYGGGTNPTNKVMGNIDVTIDHSLVSYYCGGPRTGDMEPSRTITTRATSTTFGRYFGAGNGGTSYALRNRDDKVATGHGSWWIQNYTPLQRVDDNNYYAKFRFEIWSIPPGDRAEHPGRYYYYCAQFAATVAHEVSSTLDSCTVLGDFYGAGTLGSVDGDGTSPLNNTTVLGNAFGAGYSASIPSFWVYTKDGITLPHRDQKSGICHEAILGDSALYTWTNVSGTTTPIKSAIRNTTTPETPNLLYTSAPLTNLGTVTGKVRLTIGGKSVIGRIDKPLDPLSGNVYGGGNESKVVGQTLVTIKDETIVVGDVYGGGNNGDVDGKTDVVVE